MYNQKIFWALSSFIAVVYSFPAAKEEIESHDYHQESDSKEAIPYSFEYSIDGRVSGDEKVHHDSFEDDEVKDSYGTSREGAEYKIHRNDALSEMSGTPVQTLHLQKREQHLHDESQRNKIDRDIQSELTRLIEHHEGIYRHKQINHSEHRTQDDDNVHDEKIHHDEPFRRRQPVNYNETSRQNKSDLHGSINRHHSIRQPEITIDQEIEHHSDPSE